MSQLYINHLPAAYEPDPRFEYSSSIYDSDVEPFWQQYPIWALPSQLRHLPLRPNNNYYKYAMEENHVVIGYNTKNGKKLPQGQTGKTVKSPAKPRPKGKVDVYIDQTFIRQAPLGLLVRFSTAAQATFPKPQKNAPAEDKEPVKHEWAEDEDKIVDVEKLTADIAKLSHTTSPEKVGKSTSKNRRLDLGLDTLWTQPPVDAFLFAFDWMHAAQSSKSDDLLEFGVPAPDRLSLEKLVDLYAAALCLGLRPKPRKHLADLFDRLTKYPPSLADIVYIHEHLPVSDSVMTRAISSFLTNRGAVSEVYNKDERLAIEKYFSEVDEDLYTRFKDILEYREGHRRAVKRDQNASRLQRLAEGTDSFDNDGQDGEQTEDGAGPPAIEGGGRGRKCRAQKEGGKKVNGKVRTAS